MSQMTFKKKRWGTKTAWSMSFFEMVPCAAEEQKNIGATPAMICNSSQGPMSAACSPASKAVGASSANSPPPSNPGKMRKTQELDARTQWRCRRCGAMLQPPLDAATGKPRYGVMMTEHLEGVSSGGTTHLATGVVVCSAGTLQFKRTPGDERSVGSAQPSKRHRDDLHENTDCGTATMENGVSCGSIQTRRDEESDGKMAARNALRGLLHHCQQAAQHHATTNASPSPILFIVVENPKTPANAGGILRAMRCYGVRGPGATMGDAAASLPSSAAQPSSVEGTPESAEESVLQRVGGFIFSGSRLEKAMAYSEYAHTLRTDPTHAREDIPLHCVPTLDTLFDVLRDDHGHRQQGQPSPSTPLVRVVAVELVEGAVALPHFEHPFSHTPRQSSSQSAGKDGASSVDRVPMVFYLLGPEDGTISTHHVEHDVDEVVFVPTTGSMNLAASVNVLLYDRLAKECCGVRPSAAAATSTSDHKWKAVFKTRNANNRLRWNAVPSVESGKGVGGVL